MTSRNAPKVAKTNSSMSAPAAASALLGLFDFKPINQDEVTKKFKLDTSGDGTVVGRGPEVRAVLGHVLKKGVNGRGPFVLLYPYECVNPGTNGTISNAEFGKQQVLTIPGTRGTKGQKWDEREQVDVEFAMRTEMAMAIPQKYANSIGTDPGTGIVLCSVSASIVDSEQNGTNTYFNCAFIRKDDNFEFDHALEHTMRHPILPVDYVNRVVSFVVVPETNAQIVNPEWPVVQVGAISVPVYDHGELGADGNNKDFFKTSLKINTINQENVSTTMFANVTIYRNQFSKAFDITSPALIEGVGCQMLARSRLLVSGEIYRFLPDEEESTNGSGIFYLKKLFVNLREVVTTCGFPVSKEFARAKYRNNTVNPLMTMDRKVVLLNECAYPNKVQEFFKNDGYKFYAITNIDVPDEMKVNGTVEPKTTFDEVLLKYQKNNTVYAIYTVKV